MHTFSPAPGGRVRAGIRISARGKSGTPPWDPPSEQGFGGSGGVPPERDPFQVHPDRPVWVITIRAVDVGTLTIHHMRRKYLFKVYASHHVDVGTLTIHLQ